MRGLTAVLTGAFLAAGCAAQSQTPVTSTVTVTVTAPPVAASPGSGITDRPSPPLPITTSRSETPAEAESVSYSQDGVYSVGTVPSGGLSAAIPPGRYRADVKTTGPYADYGGTWIRCSSHTCSPTNVDNIIDIGNVMMGELPPVVDIMPTDVAVSITGLVLTPVG